MSYISVKEYAEKYNITEADVYLYSVQKTIDTQYNNGTLLVFDKAPAEHSKEESPVQVHKEEIKPSADNQEKDRLLAEIAELKSRLDEKDKQIEKYTLLFADLALQAQQIASQAQHLHNKEKPALIEAPAGEEKTESITPKKNSLFKRIFNKKKVQ